MGRLFWKFFAVLSAGIVLGTAVVIGGVRLARAFAWLAPVPPDALPLWPPLLGALLSSSLLGGLLAWYVSNPIRQLRWAFHELAIGNLDSRLAPRMGRRSDELAELGLEFDRMAQRLQTLVGAQRRLLHDVSHELRSPLARMQAAIGIGLQQPSRAGQMLERIERESQRLDALVGELLTLARLESGTASPKLAAVDMLTLIRGICADASFEARARQREVLFHGRGAFVAQADAEMLHRAFDNVVRNAVKFTVAYTTVEVDATVEGEALTVTVADRGPGVSAAGRDQMFEPFRRVGVAPTEGFGLGLSIARRAIESHGGRIDALDRDGGGLVMRIVIPG